MGVQGIVKGLRGAGEKTKEESAGGDEESQKTSGKHDNHCLPVLLQKLQRQQQYSLPGVLKLENCCGAQQVYYVHYEQKYEQKYAIIVAAHSGRAEAKTYHWREM